MTRTQIQKLREVINKELKDVGRKIGFEFQAGNATFSENNVTFKLTASQIINGEVISPIIEDFKTLAPLHGLKESDLNKTLTYRGDVYKIIGWRRTSHKYPVVVERESNKRRYKLTVEQTKMCLTK